MRKPLYAVSWAMVLGGLACGLGCGDDEPAASFDPNDADTSEPRDAGADANVDAAMPPDAAGTGGSSWSGFDASIFENLPDEICLSSVPAECDGPEDCGNDSVCCATFDPRRVNYSGIECKASCSNARQEFALCHPDGARCSLSSDDERECRRSVVLLHDFIGVCAPPNELAQTTLRGEEMSGSIECGAERCMVGTQKCCLNVSFKVREERRLAPSSHCMPLDAPCDCDAPGEPRPDAGVDGGVDAASSDEDAGL